ncbi:hypothetical protein EDD21DRAFT_59447, partial [Dissophora ornata]
MPQSLFKLPSPQPTNDLGIQQGEQSTPIHSLLSSLSLPNHPGPDPHSPMGNTPSNVGNGTQEPGAAVESVTFTNSHYQKQQQQHGDYMTHQRHNSSPHAFPPQGPQDSIHPSSIPQRRTQQQQQQLQQQQQQQQQQTNSLPGGGPRRRASSLLSGQPFVNYTNTYNEQVLVATAAHHDKQEQQRLQQQSVEGRASYRNSARVSRAFETVDPLKSLDVPHDGRDPTFCDSP